MIFTETIKKNNEFSRLYKNGSYYTSKYLTLYSMEGKPGRNALGVVAGKKTGKSVRRNRLKRLIKENYRLYEEFIHSGMMLVFIAKAKKDSQMPDFFEIRHEMKYLFLRAGAFDKQKWESLRNKA